MHSRCLKICTSIILDNEMINQQLNSANPPQQRHARSHAGLRRFAGSRPALASDPTRVIERAVAHASRRGTSNPVVMLNSSLADDAVEPLSAEARLGEVRVKLAN